MTIKDIPELVDENTFVNIVDAETRARLVFNIGRE